MVAHFGLDVVKAYMQHVQDNAEESVRRLLSRLEDGAFRVEMDQGTWVDVKITVDRENRRARVDFSGTSPEQPNNFNAPEPVTRAATLYVFRVMVNEPIPMNAGCLKPIDIVIPERSMLKPAYPAAVVAGNVETSQIVTNCLFAALKAMGPSQGTMNNLTFGNAKYQYYETICSGSPAGPGFDGTSGVHVHMTNTRLTDPEILELRYPVLLEEFGIRRGSGGKGKWSAGDGTERRIRFLEKMDCAILSSFRKVRPYGLEGGEPGECGENWVRRNDGRMERLEGCDQTVLEPGEAVIVKTPTGGGFGQAVTTHATQVMRLAAMLQRSMRPSSSVAKHPHSTLVEGRPAHQERRRPPREWELLQAGRQRRKDGEIHEHTDLYERNVCSGSGRRPKRRRASRSGGGLEMR